MIRENDRIRLREKLCRDFLERGVRPYYFNDMGFMDYMFNGEVMVADGVMADSRVYVKRKSETRDDDVDYWVLRPGDLEVVRVVDNRKVGL